MRSFVRGLFRSLKWPKSPQQRPFSDNSKMANSATSAILYAATISAASITGAVPEEAGEKRHHLKDGKGFDNPWESWRSFTAPSIIKAMVLYANHLCFGWLS